MLELHDVWKRVPGRRQRWMVSGVNMVLPPGLRIALLGHDKQENTLLLRMLAGLDLPDRGTIRRVGLTCWPLDDYTFLDTRATFRQNASFLGLLYGADIHDVERIAAELAGIRPKEGKILRHYTGEEKRQIAVGLAMAVQFDWYFVNEKVPPLPPAVAEMIDSAIADRVSRASIIWASRNALIIEKYCNAALVLDRGTLTFYDDIDEACAAHRARYAKAARS